MDNIIYKNIIQYSLNNLNIPKYTDSYSNDFKYLNLITVSDYNIYNLEDFSNLNDPMDYNTFFNLHKSVVFANLDSIINFTNLNSNLTVLNINEIPGGFIEYINYKKRDDNTFIYAIGNRSFGEYNLQKIPNYNLKRLYGSDNFGNLKTDFLQYIKILQAENPLGLDLVYAGMPQYLESIGFDLNTEMYYFQLLISGLILHSDGMYICEINRISGKFIFDYLYLCSLIFENIRVIKTYSNNLWSTNYFLICVNRKSDIQRYIDLILDVIKSKNMYIFESYPAEFVNYITNIFTNIFSEISQLAHKYKNNEITFSNINNYTFLNL